MNISSVGSSSSLAYLRKLSSATTTSSSASTGEATDADSVKLSRPAEMMKKLEALQQSDPAKFKETVSKIAESLQEASKSASGEGAQRLSDMASKFSAAADSGDLSSLQPPAGGPRGGHGAGGPRGAHGGPPPPPPPSSQEAGDDSTTTATTSTSSAAISAYKKQQTREVDSAFKSAMDNAFKLVDDATSSLDV